MGGWGAKKNYFLHNACENAMNYHHSEYLGKDAKGVIDICLTFHPFSVTTQ